MRFVRLLFAVSLAISLAACDPGPKLAGSGMDMFAPTAVRLHPLSRIMVPVAPSAGAPILEAHVELTDQFSDPTKSPGTLKLELFDQPLLTHKGQLLQQWTFSIDKPEENRDHWDRTTRTYLFKLPISQALPQREQILAVITLTLPNGAVLTDEMEMPLR